MKTPRAKHGGKQRNSARSRWASLMEPVAATRTLSDRAGRIGELERDRTDRALVDRRKRRGLSVSGEAGMELVWPLLLDEALRTNVHQFGLADLLGRESRSVRHGTLQILRDGNGDTREV
ncbi:MAG: hypothetical protein WC497_05220 [Patescibacteria group bacterium]